jgi:putative aminopeptidase FrvX
MNQAVFGARTGGIGVATRYPHCQSSIVSKDDIEEGIRLITAFCKYSFSF